MELVNSGKFYQLPPEKQVLMQHLWKVMDDLQRAVAESGLTLEEANTILLGYVQSVTDDGLGGISVDNTDPQNPILSFVGVADGVTITGTGVTADPFVAIGGGGDSLSPLLLMGG